jgi:DNA-binding IclR family transcriptional regulator
LVKKSLTGNYGNYINSPKMINDSHRKRINMSSKNFASLEKAIDILDLFNIGSIDYSAKEISAKLFLPLSTTYKYLEVLSNRQLLSKNTITKKYRLGPMVFRLGRAFTENIDFLEIAKPRLKSLAKSSSETVMITLIDGWDATCLDKIEPQRLIRLSIERGRRLPLHAGASSRILLAFQSDEFIEKYIRTQSLKPLTKNTIINPNRLRRELKTVREKGVAISDSEVDSSAKAISAPIFDADEMLVAGLTVAGPSERINDELMTSLIEQVRQVARSISYDLGFTEENLKKEGDRVLHKRRKSKVSLKSN